MKRSRPALACSMVAILALAYPAIVHAANTTLEAESLVVSPASGGSTYQDSSASGGVALGLWSNSSASKNISLPASSSIVVRAMGQQCQGAPTMTVSVDGTGLSSTSVTATTWTNYTTTSTIAAGTHTVAIAFTNDYYKSERCDRNLLLDNVTILPAATSTTTTTAPATPPVVVQPGAVTPFSATDVNNAKRGQYENLGVGLFPQTYPAQKAYAAWPAASDAGTRYDWRTLQPTATTFNFAPIDADIAKAAATGKRFHFRVAAFNSCCQTSYANNTDIGVPDWLRATSGATSNYALSGVTYVIPNWNNNAYLTAAEKLIAALGARYNKDERVEWFEFSGYGDFSENHVAFMRDNLKMPGPTPANSIAQLGYYSQYQEQYITKPSITRLVNATLSAFPDTQVVATSDNPEIIRQLTSATVAKPVGIRGDCLGVYEPPNTWAVNQYSYYVQNNDPVVSTILNRWKTAPVITEWCNWEPNGDLAFFQKALGDTVNYHVSLVSSAVSPYQGSTAMPANIFDLWSKTNKYAGYRYAVTAASVPGTTAIGTALPVTVRWANFGDAPTYDKWQVNYEVRDASNTVVKTIPSTMSLAGIAAAQNYTDTSATPVSQTADDAFSIPTTGLTAGNYTLVAKVVWNEHKSGGTNVVNFAPMNLAQAGRDSGGGYPIGSFTAS